MTDSIVLAKTEAATEHPQIQAMLEELQDFEIQNSEDQETVAEGIQFFKATWSRFEEKRKKLTVPLNEALKEANNVYREILEASKEGERILKQKVAGFLVQQDQTNRAAIEVAAEAETQEEASEALSQIETVEAPKGMSVRQVWRFEIINEGLVPWEYMSPDINKITMVLPKADQEPPYIPGVRFFKESIVTARVK